MTYSVPIVLLAILSIASGAHWNKWKNKRTPEPTTTSTLWSTSTTAYPTPYPSPWPTYQPTPEPTDTPTHSPLMNACSFSRCAEIVMVVDNTGGLSEGSCSTQMDNIGELLSSFKGNNKRDNPNVAYVEVNANRADIIVHLDDKLNRDIGEYTRFVRSQECGADEGATNLDAGMLAAIGELISNGNEECIQKIVIVMNCDTADREVICENAPEYLQNFGIEVVQINALGADCGIHEPHNYLDCITNDICCVRDLRDDSSWRQCIDEQQYVICDTPTTNPTEYPSATPWPTPWPTPLPTPWPTNYPETTEETTTTTGYEDRTTSYRHSGRNNGYRGSSSSSSSSDSEETTTTTSTTSTTAYEDDSSSSSSSSSSDSSDSDETTTTTAYDETTTEYRHSGRNNHYANSDDSSSSSSSDSEETTTTGYADETTTAYRHSGRNKGNNDAYRAWRR